jgi:uncharacterized membrane protein
MSFLPLPAITFLPALPLPLIIALGGGAAVLAVVLTLRGRPAQPAWLRGPALLLRLAALSIITVILLNPSSNVSLPGGAQRSVILVDASASMSLAGTGESTRWAEALAWTREVNTALKSDGLPTAEVLRFASEVQPLTLPEIPDPNGKETRLAAALEHFAGSANAGSTDHVIVVSDGCASDAPRLSTALASLRQAGISLSSKVLGREAPARNATLLSVLPPRLVRAQSRVILPVEMEAGGFSARDGFELILRDDQGAEIVRQPVTFPSTALPGRSTASRKLAFTSPARTTGYRLELSGPPGEATLEDNQFAFTLEVVSTKLRVLLAEGTHAKRSLGPDGHFLNEIQMLTSAWTGTGEMEVSTFTPLSQYVDGQNLYAVDFVNGDMRIDPSRGFPSTKAEIQSYDVIMISDVPVGNFSPEQMQLVVDWVLERGGGFLMAGGNTSFDTGNYDKTPWEKITPVDMLDYGDGHYGMGFEIRVPKSARSHPLWQIADDPADNDLLLDSHPSFSGMNRVRRAKPGAVVLAVVADSPDQPVMSAQEYGRGRSIAYLPDPNGGWGEQVIRWGPDNAPALGDRIELGHGGELGRAVAQARNPTAPIPPYPSPYYGRFWVNTVRWLAENSIRWRRDKLSGKILSAQTRPGSALPVTAEFLAETNPAMAAVQDIGARLNLPGSPRVRLAYDRDRREFTGTLKVPAELTVREVQVLFDTTMERESLTDILTCSVLTESWEYTRSAPDAPLMAGIAEAGGGRVLTTPESAVQACRAAFAARTARDAGSWSQPAWNRWPWWAAVFSLLALEWLLRRRGRHQEVSPPAPFPTEPVLS